MKKLIQAFIIIVAGALVAFCTRTSAPKTDKHGIPDAKTVTQKSPPPTTGPASVQGEKPVNAIIDEETKRVRVLLGPERVRFPLQDTQPLMTPDSIGALAGIGFASKDPEVYLSVYIYPTWHQDPKTVEKLKEHVPFRDALTLQGINGCLFFFGYAQVDGPNGNTAKFRLMGLVSAIAGDE